MSRIKKAKRRKIEFQSASLVYYGGLMFIFITGMVIALYIASSEHDIRLREDGSEASVPVINLDKINSAEPTPDAPASTNSSPKVTPESAKSQ